MLLILMVQSTKEPSQGLAYSSLGGGQLGICWVDGAHLELSVFIGLAEFCAVTLYLGLSKVGSHLPECGCMIW